MVRSDYDVTLKLLRTDGEVRATGAYVSRGQPEEDNGDIRLVHLQRLDAKERWLATLSAPPLRVDLWPLSDGKADGSRHHVEVTLTGVDEHILQFRWLDDGKSLVLMGTHQIWVATPDTRHPKTVAKAQRVFPDKSRDMSDTRVVPGGFIVRTVEQGVWPYPYDPGEEGYDADEEIYWGEEEFGEGAFWRGHIYRVPVTGGTPRTPIDLTPDGYAANGATVLSGGRVAIALGVFLSPDEYDRIDAGELEARKAALHVLKRNAAKPTDVVATYPCGEDDWCYADNWAPGTRHPIYINDQRILIHEAPGRPAREIALPEDWWGHTHGLWADEAARTVLVASADQIALYDLTSGDPRWRWMPSGDGDQLVRSVHFRPDGRTVVAAVGEHVLELRDGKARQLVRGVHGKAIAALQSERAAKSEARSEVEVDEEAEWSDTTRFVDNVIPLSSGDVAYAVVTLRTTEEYEGDFDPDPKLHMALPDDLLDER